jgi:hypothetical protein
VTTGDNLVGGQPIGTDSATTSDKLKNAAIVDELKHSHHTDDSGHELILLGSRKKHLAEYQFSQTSLKMAEERYSLWQKKGMNYVSRGNINF